MLEHVEWQLERLLPKAPAPYEMAYSIAAFRCIVATFHSVRHRCSVPRASKTMRTPLSDAVAMKGYRPVVTLTGASAAAAAV